MYVYHGSSDNFDIAKPSHTSRGHKTKSGRIVQDYEGISLHATPYKWIAISYMAEKRANFTRKGNKYYFSHGVPVRTKNQGFYNKNVYIQGKRSLEYSLEKIYGKGGYLYTFDAKHFKHFIKDPVKMMKKEGVKFIFVDITKS